jgi:hypothetical protein
MHITTFVKKQLVKKEREKEKKKHNSTDLD